MRVGEPVECLHRPLSVALGPGLIGSIYDGIQRPLPVLKGLSGAFLKPGLAGEPLDSRKEWHFVPSINKGDPIGPGTVFGTIQETESIQHRLIFDASVPASTAAYVAPEGDYTLAATLVGASDGRNYTAVSYWPVRTPRKFKENR